MSLSETIINRIIYATNRFILFSIFTHTVLTIILLILFLFTPVFQYLLIILFFGVSISYQLITYVNYPKFAFVQNKTIYLFFKSNDKNNQSAIKGKHVQINIKDKKAIEDVFTFNRLIIERYFSTVQVSKKKQTNNGNNHFFFLIVMLIFLSCVFTICLSAQGFFLSITFTNLVFHFILGIWLFPSEKIFKN